MGFRILFSEALIKLKERKLIAIAVFSLYLTGLICGLVLANNAPSYDYFCRICDRYMNGFCFSKTNVFLLFLQRMCANVLFLIVFTGCGAHPAALIVLPVSVVYRSYTFGGSLFVFFRVYGFSGMLVVFLLFLPVRLLVDTIYLCEGVFSVHNACYCRKFDFRRIVRDFLLGVVCLAAVSLLEMLLLLIFFHPIGNVL